MKKPSVIVVGAGLAGLAATYELTKTKKFTVTLLEAQDRIGGRTATVYPSGVPIDVGGFIIYPWYETFHKIAQELNCENAMVPIPKNEIFYNFLDKKTFISEKEVPISLATKGKIAARVLPALLNNLSVAHPNLARFGNKTTREFLNEILPSPADEPFKNYFDSICQGYCYPSINEFQIAFLLPMWGNNLFFGDIKSASYYPKGMQTFHKAIEKVIIKNGGIIKTSTPVLSVNKNNVKTPQENLRADFIVVTHPLNNHVRYTRFATLTLACKGKTIINENDTWGALFLHPETCKDPNILSVINSKFLAGKKAKGILTLNIKLNEEEDAPLTKEYEDKITNELKKIFPKLTSCAITSRTLWSHTMPIGDASYVTRIKKSQGKNGIFYAGDFLGSPSMETALTTGVDAARGILAYHHGKL